MKDLAEILDGSTAGSILEIGCGRGQFLQNLVESLPQAKRVVGVDVIDPRTTVMPELLNRPGTEWITAYGHDLSFEDNSFDVVCLAHVLHHLQPDLLEPTLAEMKRVLRPGGVFLLCEMYHDNQADAQMSHVFYHHWMAEIDRHCGVHHYPTFSRNEILGVIDSLSFLECDVEEFNEDRDAEYENEKIAEVLDKIEKKLELAVDSPDYERLKQEAQSIHVWILTHGLVAPTRVLAYGRNQ